MLREQDDPNTKIGKANDDSVLFPKRASKLNLFGNNDLSDIAEVASISGSIRPPFARERMESYSSADGYGTDDDGKSIMSRTRQVKGNKFFANRQKVYMIPAGGSASMKELRQTGKATDSTARATGKVVYDDDVHLSKFKHSAEGNAEGRTSDDNSHGGRDSDDHERRSSLQHSDHSSSKRETSSSTNSGPLESRASTAATSVASQSASPMHGPPASNGAGFPFNKQSFSTSAQDRTTKGKRLYGQGIDQQIHEQQRSALHRLNSIQRPYGVPHSRSATNLNDRFQKPAQLYSSNTLRTMSPVPGSSSTLAGFDFGTQGEELRSDSRETNYSNTTPPKMSPPMSPTSADPTLAAALEPNDLGKATASGAFNKPKTSYSDEQFARRQMQLQEGRESPAPLSFSKPGAYNNMTSRDRNGSLASQMSSHSASSQTKIQSAQQPAPLQYRKQEPTSTNNRLVNGAYLASQSGSELGSEPTSPIDLAMLKTAAQSAMSRVVDPSSRHRRYEHDDQHPAFNSHLDLSEEDRNSGISQALPLQSTDGGANAINADSSNIIDSPTLPVADDTVGSSSGLNDLIKGHLRNVSNTSSVYPDEPPHQSRGFYLDGQDGMPNRTTTAAPSNPLDNYVLEEEQVSEDPLSMRARRILDQANQLKNASSKPYEILGGVGSSKIQQVLGGEAPRRSNETTRNALQDVMKGHTRGASTETQKEREDFASELADRRKQVQDNLNKSFVAESRSASPSGTRYTDNNQARVGPLGLLKKASRSSMVGKSENPSKAMKMLGVGSTQAPPSTNAQPSVVSPEGFQGSRPVLNSDIRQRVARLPVEQQVKVRPGNGPSFRDRSIGAERRAGVPRGTSPAPNHGPERAQSSKQPSPKPNGYAFPRSKTDTFNPHTSGSGAGRPRKYSPPGVSPRKDEYFDVRPQAARSASAQGHYRQPPPGQYNSNGSYFPGLPRSPNPHSHPFSPPFSESPRPSPVNGNFPVRGTPPTEQPPHPSRNGPSPSPAIHVQQHRKRSVNKDDISNPIFQSGTSTVLTVDLPNGASLANGMNEVRADAPPLPPINPRRRKGAPAGNLFTSFVNKSSNNLTALSTPSSAATSPHSGTPFLHDAPNYEEKSTFSSGEDEPKTQRPRARLRKSSSDGGNMAARARHQALKEMEQMKMPGTPLYATDNGSKGMF
ncbi:hypothetical protein MMC10_008405 [Thelotrema lepadinum]|nr:hypothetical protein [Thelotrema lepadinum]